MAIETIGLIGAGVSALGTISQGFAQRDMANYQAAVARNNEQIAYQKEQYAREAGAVATEAAGRQARARQGQLLTGLAAGGIDVNTGSAEDVRRSQQEIGTYNQQATEQNALLSAYGYRTQASGFAAEARMDEAAASNAIPGALFKAAGGLAGSVPKFAGFGDSLLSGTSDVPLKYQWMRSSTASL